MNGWAPRDAGTLGTGNRSTTDATVAFARAASCTVDALRIGSGIG